MTWHTFKQPCVYFDATRKIVIALQTMWTWRRPADSNIPFCCHTHHCTTPHHCTTVPHHTKLLSYTYTTLLDHRHHIKEMHCTHAFVCSILLRHTSCSMFMYTIGLCHRLFNFCSCCRPLAMQYLSQIEVHLFQPKVHTYPYICVYIYVYVF